MMCGSNCVRGKGLFFLSNVHSICNETKVKDCAVM